MIKLMLCRHTHMLKPINSSHQWLEIASVLPSFLLSFLPQGSAFFIVQFSHPYMINGKAMALARRIFVASAF